MSKIVHNSLYVKLCKQVHWWCMFYFFKIFALRKIPVTDWPMPITEGDSQWCSLIDPMWLFFVLHNNYVHVMYYLQDIPQKFTFPSLSVFTVWYEISNGGASRKWIKFDVTAYKWWWTDRWNSNIPACAQCAAQKLLVVMQRKHDALISLC